ncbi:MAG: tyrosine-protein phosphatase [Isosphaeraceae bacterium]|nr:tyrosine-protein phosphatase [Isosphaeraceae bacterium]
MSRSIRRRTILALLLCGVAAGGVAALFAATSNFGTVIEGSIYRAGQMSPEELASTLKRYGIRTVLNLRGQHPEAEWYRKELETTLAAGAVQVDVALSSCDWISRAQGETLLHLLETSATPILIHCFHGSERTGLVSSLAALLRPASSIEDGYNQFTIKHMYFHIGDGARMREHLDLYTQWLDTNGHSHSPERIREWLLREYRPGSPSREEWPYDPYPLRVTTRRLSDRGGASTPEVEIVWTPGSEPGSVARMESTRRAPLNRVE